MIRGTILGLVPARGGSQGVPRKNTRIVAGKPLIYWTICEALKCSRITRTVVSTDDPEISTIALQCGAEVPFPRPAELATSTATSAEVALHAVDSLERLERWSPEFLLMLQPTSPLRTAQDIAAMIAMRDARDADAIISVGPLEHPPSWIRRIGPEQQLLPWLDEKMPLTRQFGEALHQLNGALYMIRVSALRAQQSFFPPNALAFPMPTDRSVDIDTLNDLILAEQLLLRRAASVHGVCD